MWLGSKNDSSNALMKGADTLHNSHLPAALHISLNPATRFRWRLPLSTQQSCHLLARDDMGDVIMTRLG